MKNSSSRIVEILEATARGGGTIVNIASVVGVQREYHVVVGVSAKSLG